MNGSEGVLFGRSALRRRLLSYLFAVPGRAIHPSAAARELGFTPQAVARELDRLERASILASDHIGRVRQYRVRDDSPLVGELRGLVAKTIGVEGLLREALTDLPGVDEAMIFGSYARGEVGPSSDVDVLVIGSPDPDLLTDRIAVVEQQVGREVSLVTYARSELDRLLRAGDTFVRDVFDEPRVELTGGRD